MASLYAGPSAGLARAVERRAEEIRLNPPTPVPTATPRPTPSPTPIPTSAIYQVQKGDTLKTIADKFGVSVSALAEINNLTDINALDIGQTLLIPKKP
ncbi:MAG: LysM peptidoglycan-binding domain-containing protein, partial [Chloroflexi bacterium]|nr:LysM peptidoglycan-binding domain-containing protein [Chloroflexota bacterium]MBC7255756.1 LysM peptidoglycan-binding domain-containing protein [Chloroflexota bacterium]